MFVPPLMEAVVHLSHRLATVGPLDFASAEMLTKVVAETLTSGLPPRCLHAVKLFQSPDTFGAPKSIAPNPNLHLARRQWLFRAGASLSSTSMSWIANVISSMIERDGVLCSLPIEERVLPDARMHEIMIVPHPSPLVLL